MNDMSQARRLVYRRQTVAAVAIMIAASMVMGCDSGPELAPLSGKVLLDDKPLEFGSVMLQPLEGGQPSAASIASDGTFNMETRGYGEGAAVGKNAVRVTCFPGQKPGAAASGGEIALGQPLIHSDYSSFSASGLVVDVKPEDNPEYIIQLSRQGP